MLEMIRQICSHSQIQKRKSFQLEIFPYYGSAIIITGQLLTDGWDLCGMSQQ